MRPKPLRIAMITDVFDKVRNGAAISTQRFVKLLNEKHDVQVVTTGEPGDGKVILSKMPFGRQMIQKWSFCFAWPNKKQLEAVISTVDVVHVQFPFWLGIRAIKIAKKLNVPVVSSFHTQAENVTYNFPIIASKSTQWARKIYQFHIKHFYGKTDHVIFPSQFAADEIRSHGLKVPGTIISNGFPENFQPLVVSRPDKHQNKFVIIMVGRLTKEKSQDRLLKAVLQCQHKDRIQVIIVGKGPEKSQLMKLGQQLPNPPEFHSPSTEELIQHHNKADLFVHTSDIELECMSALEAIACSLPTLLSDAPKSAAKQFALNHHFIYDHKNINDLAAKIDYWIEHPAELRAAKQSYLEKSTEYKIENSYKKLEAVYYSVAGYN